jgi:hypothetical protein
LASPATLATGGAGIASAQSNTATMDVGLTMLERAVGNKLRKFGMAHVEIQPLTLHERSQIKAVFEDRDYSNTARAEQVRRIIAAN